MRHPAQFIVIHSSGAHVHDHQKKADKTQLICTEVCLEFDSVVAMSMSQRCRANCDASMWKYWRK